MLSPVPTSPRAAMAPAVLEGFHALADPTRLEILRRLARGERCVCDLNAGLDLTQPLLSFHLRVLRRAGLVHTRKQGRWAYYAMDPAGLARLRGQLERLEAAAEQVLPQHLAACCG